MTTPTSKRKRAKEAPKKPAMKHPVAKKADVRRNITSLVATAQKVSAADRARAESLLAEVGRRKERIAEDFYDIGLALSQLSKKKLYLALGYPSFEAMLKEREVMSPTTARGLMKLVSAMKRDEALSYGQEKALALLSYAGATPEVDTPKTLMEGSRLPGGKAVAEASVRDLRQAAKEVRSAQGKAKPKSAEEKAALAEAKALGAWLRARGAAKAKVSASRGKGGYVLKVELPVAASARLRSS